MSAPSDVATTPYLEFATPDVVGAKAFFQDAFGWEFTDYGPNYTSFTAPGLSGGLSSDGAATPAGNPLVVIHAHDLESMMEKVKRAGGAITRATFEFPGGRRFHFRTPGALELAVWSDRRADGSKID